MKYKLKIIPTFTARLQLEVQDFYA